MSTLKEIVQVYKQSLLNEEDRRLMEDFDLVLEAAIDPALQLVDDLKEMKQANPDKLIFECNCTLFVRVSSVSSFSSEGLLAFLLTI